MNMNAAWPRIVLRRKKIGSYGELLSLFCPDCSGVGVIKRQWDPYSLSLSNPRDCSKCLTTGITAIPLTEFYEDQSSICS